MSKNKYVNLPLLTRGRWYLVPSDIIDHESLKNINIKAKMMFFGVMTGRLVWFSSDGKIYKSHMFSNIDNIEAV